MTSAPRPNDTLASARLRCIECDATYPAGDPRPVCDCGGLLDVEHPGVTVNDVAEWRTRAPRAPRGPTSASSGVWAYRELVMPASPDEIVSLPEGFTPLLERAAVAQWAGSSQLLLKHEGLNPTGSFKDRGMTVAVTHARLTGARSIACASTGNTASSLAAYATLAGVEALVMVPDGSVAEGKLAQTLAYGARVLLINGNFDQCLRLVRDAAERLGVYLANSVNPWRVEGQKTIVFELLEQLGWDPPDWIALPAGNLGNASAFGKALREARELGLIERTPRLLLVQAEGAAPFARSAADAFRARVRVVEPNTVATAIRIGDPASYSRAVRVVRETNAIVSSVSDAEILEAKAVIDASGTGCEPASAASVAGVRRLVREGVISPGERVVAVLTGHLLKDPGAALASLASSGEGRGRGIRVEPTLQAVEAVLGQSGRGA